MREVSIRLVATHEIDLVLSADVFDTPASVEATRRFLGQGGQPDTRNILIVALLDRQVVGFASGTILDHPDKPPTLFVNELGVHESARRQGIARRLLQAIRAEGRRRGCKTTWVATEGDNLAARGLYRAAGGKETEGIAMYEWDEGETP